MDRTELRVALEVFRKGCEKIGKPLTDLHLEEAYPGISSTSYIVEVKADWFDELSCSEILDILVDVLFQTTGVETRQNIFIIKVADNENSSRLMSEQFVLG